MANTTASKADLKRSNLTSHYFRKAYDRDSKVVYINSFIPSEIFHAMGVVPFNLGIIGGILAQGKASSKFINSAQQNHYSSDLCSTSRCIMGAALSNALPTPDYLIMTSGPCDVGSNIYYYLSRLYQKEWFLLDVPVSYNNPERAIGYLASQLRKMVNSLETLLGLELKPERLQAAIEYSNSAADYVQKTNQFAKLIPSPLAATETMEIISSLHLLGLAEMIDICRERYEEIDQKARTARINGSRKPRILWHGLRPFYSNEIFEHLEKNCKVEIISEVDMHGGAAESWEFLDPNEPYRSMAVKMMKIMGGYSINESLLRQTAERLNDYAIDGVISFNSRGCRHMLSVNQVLRDVISRNNRPFLEIDGDYIDDRDYSFEQIKTRLDAFAELLYGRMQ